ncbi:hypothetical protein JTF08_11615 [Micrococcaceae bacterium RIT802]|nr:hypothetical protein [Micrococcaceae bacterium RIT 802]
MFATFPSDLIVGAIVAVATAAIAVFLGRRSYRKERMKREISGLRRLIGELARKRALVEPKSLTRVWKARDGHADFDGVSSSVLDVRRAIDEARLAARDDVDSEVHTLLDQMSMHCNEYLHNSRHDSRNYRALIHDLRLSLKVELHELCRIHPELPKDEPGSKAYAQRTDKG